MATAYTSLLGLALPVTGELSGTWGDTVNNSITSLLDTSVAGTTNVSTDGNVTLTTTTGAANTARQAILLFSGARTAIRTVTAPAQSKIYTVINATTGGFAVTLVGAGPTTGVTIANGARTVVAWNGSDFVEVSSPSSIILPGGTANGVLYLNGSKVVTSGSALTFDGTSLGVGTSAPVGRLTLNANTVLPSAGAFAGTNLWQVGADATANGYLIDNFASGATITGRRATGTAASPTALASGATMLNILGRGYGATGYSSGARVGIQYITNETWTDTAQGASILFNTTPTGSTALAEQMRLDSTGLGIGTSSPSAKLHVVGAGLFAGATSNSLGVTSTSGSALINLNTTGTGGRQFYIYASDNTNAVSGGKLVLEDATSGNQLIYAGASGNLGLGVTPSAWSGGKAIEAGFAGRSLWGFTQTVGYLTTNAYYNSGFKYGGTGAATAYEQNAGTHVFYSATSGTAGNAITFTQAMTLDASGNLLVGATSAGNAKVTSVNGIAFEARDGTQPYYQWYNSAGAIDKKYWRTGPNTSGDLQWQTVNDAYNSAAVRMTLDNAGNLGVGVTPSAWGAPTFQVGRTSVYGSGSFTAFGSNWFSSAGDKYIASDYATQYYQLNGQHVWRTAASGTAGDAITFTQAMTLTAAGDLGIGTSSPVGRLGVVSTGGNSRLSIGDTAVSTYSTMLMYGGSGKYNFQLGVQNNVDNAFEITPSTAAGGTTFSTPAVVINSSGNLLVGTTNPAENSGVGFKLLTSGQVACITTANTTNAQMSTYELYSTGAGAFRFYVGAGGTIFATSTAITAISDQRLKENVRDIDTGLNSIIALKPRRFDWKEGKGQDKKDVAGFIAQEFETVFPECVSTSKAGSDGIEYKNINYETLIPTLVKAMQEQQAIIESLKARLDAANL